MLKLTPLGHWEELLMSCPSAQSERCLANVLLPKLRTPPSQLSSPNTGSCGPLPPCLHTGCAQMAVLPIYVAVSPLVFLIHLSPLGHTQLQACSKCSITVS